MVSLHTGGSHLLKGKQTVISFASHKQQSTTIAASSASCAGITVHLCIPDLGAIYRMISVTLGQVLVCLYH